MVPIAACRPSHRAPLASACWRLVLAAVAALQLGGCAIVDWEQRRWLFNPGERTWGPGQEAAQGMDDVWIDYVSQHPDQAGTPVRLHALWLPRPEPAAPVLLFLHGVHWDVHASAPRMRNLHALGFSVLAVDYRGFGRSSDAMPSETLVAEDARAAWRWLARHHPQVRRFVFGHSLGAAVAVRLAQEVDDEAGLIVEGAFTSLADAFRSWRWGWLPIAWMITQHFDAGSRIAQVGSPVLVVHAGDDTMIAPGLGRNLFERATPPKRFVLVEGAVHENTDEVGRSLYRQAVRELFGIEPPPAAPPEAAAAGAPQATR